MTERVVVDPITRIEGHLRIEAQMDGSKIGQAYSSGTMVRGIELILKGRDPRDAWAYAQRICGVCTLVHGIASVRAVEDALNYRDPGQRAVDPQSHDCVPVRTRPRHAFLPSACARLGRRGIGVECRPEGDRRAGAVVVELAQVLARLLLRHAEEAQGASSRAGNWGSSPRPIGVIRPTSCRPRPT